MESKKYINTLKMMGVSGKDSVIFADSLGSIHLTVNDNVRQKLIDQMLPIKVMDKTLKEWYDYFYFLHNGTKIPEDYDYSLTKSIFIYLIEELLQMWYEKNGIAL